MKTIEYFRNYRPDKIATNENNTNEIRRPTYDVGEFLPEIEDSEVEIARINLASTTGDVYSIRITINEDKNYEVIINDEYETSFSEYEFEYKDIPSQGEIFDVLINMYGSGDPMPHLLNIIDFNEFKTVKEITHFIQFDSNLYPNLNEIFKDYLISNGFN
ncbi:MAG: hypothetical protein ACK5AO_04475 [bacterium]|jgi:hypothetical protein